MNKNAQKWVDALRSGKYKQGRYSLNKNGKFCCLGVACEVAAANGVPLKVTKNKKFTLYNAQRAFLPDAVIVWLGFNKEKSGEFEGALMEENDTHRQTFEQIVKIIEEAPDNIWAKSRAKKKSK